MNKEECDKMGNDYNERWNSYIDFLNLDRKDGEKIAHKNFLSLGCDDIAPLSKAEKQSNPALLDEMEKGIKDVYLETKKAEQEEKAKLQHEAKVRSGKRVRKPVAPESPYQRTNTKTGRNEPCPCGSGKKYKKCCGA